jgi:hypothetical protein
MLFMLKSRFLTKIARASKHYFIPCDIDVPEKRMAEEELKIVSISKPDGEMHWLTNIVLDAKVYKLYRNRKDLFITDRYKDQWFQVVF